MNIQPSVAIRQNYNESAELCRKIMLQLNESLLTVEEDRAMGRKGCSIDELDNFLENILNEG